MLLTPDDIQHIIEIVPKRFSLIEHYVPAAVLMLFFNRDSQTHLVYIRRTRRMRLHSGNMAFPGGKIDPEDASSLAAAMRETEEEIGILPEQYDYLGEMGLFETLTSRYDAAAHLAWCPSAPQYVRSEIEVEEIIEIPVAALLEQFRPNLDFSDADEVRYLSFHFQPRHSRRPANLWGLTARITHHFMQGLHDYLMRMRQVE